MATSPADLRMSVRSGRFASIGAPVEELDSFIAQDQTQAQPQDQAVSGAQDQAGASPPSEAIRRPPKPGVFTGALGASRVPAGLASVISAGLADPVSAPTPVAKLSIAQRMQAAASRSRSDDAPEMSAHPSGPQDLQGSMPESAALSSASPAASASAEPVVKLSASQRLQIATSADANSRLVRKEMATMKTLTRLLEAVFMRPGSLASEGERMQALSTLTNKAYELGSVVARIAGDDFERSQYIRAMSMDAAVTLVCNSWQHEREVDWDRLIEAAAETTEINQAAETIAKAVYKPVQSSADAFDRLAVSMHSAFWQVYGMGEKVNGITAPAAAEIVRDCAIYLQEREKFIVDNDLYVSWLQGSVRRMTDLVCAETLARFAGAETGPSKSDFEAILAVSRSGFEGVESYAQSILEKPNTNAVPRPVDC